MQDFTSGIIKIQRGRVADMTVDEEAACAPFLRIPEDDVLEVPMEEGTAEDYAAVLKKNREKQAADAKKVSKYVEGAHCVLGPAAEVERVWSMADAVITKRRSRMSPFLFECIMYLKYNVRLWDLSDVVEANKRRKNESMAAKKEVRAKVGAQKEAVSNWDTFYDALNAIEE